MGNNVLSSTGRQSLSIDEVSMAYKGINAEMAAQRAHYALPTYACIYVPIR